MDSEQEVLVTKLILLGYRFEHPWKDTDQTSIISPEGGCGIFFSLKLGIRAAARHAGLIDNVKGRGLRRKDGR